MKNTASIIYDIISPDGFPITLDGFDSAQKAWDYFAQWKTQFEFQGYYSSNKGRISLEDLKDFCHLKELHLEDGNY